MNPSHTDNGSLRIVFAGTPWFAAEHLRALLDDGKHQVVAAYTQPDRPTGRGKKLQASPVKQLAEQASIPVLQPLSLKTEDAATTLAEFSADLMVVVAYGMLLPAAILNTPRLGCINVHASLLPRWRGAAPIERAIMAGDTETGVTIMQMDEGLDTGPMLMSAHCDIKPEDTGDSILQRLAELGGPALLQAVGKLAAGDSNALAQPEAGITYANKITKADTVIDWRQSAAAIERQIRALYSARVAATSLHGETFKCWQAEQVQTNNTSQVSCGTITAVSKQGIDIACDNSVLRLTRIQLPGKKAMAVADILNGKPDAFVEGMRFDLPN